MKHAILLVSMMFCFLSGNSQSTRTELFNPSSLKIKEIKSNTIRSDFGPAVIGDSIYFTSYRDEVIGKSDRKLKTKEFYDLYKACMDDSGNVISERQPVKEFVTKFHDGPVSWCNKTRELFVTQSNYTDPLIKYKPFRHENVKLRIVVARLDGDQWNVAESFPYNNSEYSVGHPAINESGDTLIFASDMPGGYGETDLYFSVRKNGKWSTPVNLGSQVNTNGKDEFPFITGKSYAQKWLIFASTGHQSKGGFDLFCKRRNDSMGEIHQFQEPINGLGDDFAMNLPDNVEFGYMTSNRPGTGNDDIYKITFDKYMEYLHEILVLNGTTLHPIQGAQVNFCNRKRSETGADGLITYTSEKKMECNITASALGYKDNHKIIKMGTSGVGGATRDTILLYMAVNEQIVLKNIYYDFDKWDLLPESTKELDRLVLLMNENPEINVELNAHTDERGTEPYNLKLSLLRAQSAVDYLTSKAIDKTRLSGKGYGESQLIHQNSDGQKCTPEQHRENRRTEIYIPGFLKSEPVKQKNGDYLNEKPDHITVHRLY